MTLGRYFIKLRTSAGVSQRELARRTKGRVDHSTLSKIANDKPVRAATLGHTLRALGFSEKDDEYIKAFSFWSIEQAKTLPAAAFDTGISKFRRSNDREFQKAVNRAAAALRKMPEEDWPVVLYVLERPEALKLWMQSARLARSSAA